MEWFFATRTFRQMHGGDGGSAGVDDLFARSWGPGIGAEIMGRNKFGPQRGPWTDHEWQGWWGDEPPFRTPVFVLTHHLRPSVEMKGGTSFHFIDATPADALAAARDAAGGLDVRIGGGPATVRQFLAADLVDHMHIVLVPILLGRGEPCGRASRGWSSGSRRVGEFPQRSHPRHVHSPLTPRDAAGQRPVRSAAVEARPGRAVHAVGCKEAQFTGALDRGGAVVGTELGVDPAQVRANCVQRDGQLIGDLRPGQVRREVAQHPELARRQFLAAGAGSAAEVTGEPRTMSRSR